MILDTKNATIIKEKGSKAQFNFNTNDQVVESQTANCALLQFQATNSIYNIHENNNKLQILVQKQNVINMNQDGTLPPTNLPVIQTMIIITIPIGSYDIYTLIQVLNTQILLQSLPTPTTLSYIPSTSGPINYYNNFGIPTGNNVTPINPIDFNSTTGLVTFHLPTTSNLADWSDTFPVTSSYQFSGLPPYSYSVANVGQCGQNIYLGFYLIQTPLLQVLGFLNTPIQIPNSIYSGYGVCIQPSYQLTNTNNGSLQVSVTYSIQSLNYNAAYSISSLNGDICPSSIVDLSYPRHIYLLLSGMVTNNRCSLPSPTGNVFSCIPITSNFGDQIIWEPPTPFIQLCPNLQLNSIQIETIDEYGKHINWRNGSWRVTIGIQWSIDNQKTDDIGKPIHQPFFSLPHDPLEKEKMQAYGEYPVIKRSRYEH